MLSSNKCLYKGLLVLYIFVFAHKKLNFGTPQVPKLAEELVMEASAPKKEGQKQPIIVRKGFKSMLFHPFLGSLTDLSHQKLTYFDHVSDHLHKLRSLNFDFLSAKKGGQKQPIIM